MNKLGIILLLAFASSFSFASDCNEELTTDYFFESVAGNNDQTSRLYIFWKTFGKEFSSLLVERIDVEKRKIICANKIFYVPAEPNLSSYRAYREKSMQTFKNINRERKLEWPLADVEGLLSISEASTFINPSSSSFSFEAPAREF